MGGQPQLRWRPPPAVERRGCHGRRWGRLWRHSSGAGDKTVSRFTPGGARPSKGVGFGATSVPVLPPMGASISCVSTSSVGHRFRPAPMDRIRPRTRGGSRSRGDGYLRTGETPIETPRRNLVRWSEGLERAPRERQGIEVSAHHARSSDGALGAERLEAYGEGPLWIFQDVITDPNRPFDYSVYL